METQQFVAEFGYIANAPEGLTSLRQMIYQLAVTGSLTERAKSDEDAGMLLARIGKERQRLIRAKQYKRMLELESEPVRLPQGIVLPATWRWTRLLDIGEINPRNDAPDEQLAAFVPMSGVPQLHRSIIVAETERWGDIRKGYTHFANGDVVLAKITPCFENGKAAVMEGLPGEASIGAGTTELHVFRSIHAGVLPTYVYLFLRAPLFTVEGERNMTGTAGQKRVPTEYFATRAFPLPPAEEQSRIVAKVDELMALCDQLEQLQQDRRKLQNALRQSTLQALASAQSPHELQASWLRLQTNFGGLFSEPGDVNEVRRLVLMLGANGHLSTRLNGDDDPESLLEQMKSDQLENLSTRELREIQTLPEPVNEVGRLRVVLGHVVKLVSGQHLAPDEYNTTRDGVPYITGPAEFKSKKPVPSKWTNERRALAIAGDILITVKGSGVGKTAICDIQELAISRQLMAIRALRGIDLSYLSICIDAAEQSFQSKKFGIAIPGIGRDEVLNLGILLPSLAEQRRIVAIVAGLVLQCDELEAHLQDAVTTAQRLAASAVASFTGIAIEQDEDTAVKAPQTQLIAPLRLGTPPAVKAQAPLAMILARHDGEMEARDLWQRFGGEIDAFYAQLKTEVQHAWIDDPTYVLDPDAPNGPKKYPDGALVAKIKIKQEA
ncbi:restriction endonuclease subunit S [Xanthomonas arboricola]